MDLPGWSSLPSLPSYDQLKAQAGKTLVDAQALVTGAPVEEAAAAPPDSPPTTPDTETPAPAAPVNDVNTRQDADFDPTALRLPTRNEPTPGELIHGVERMRGQAYSDEDQQVVNRYVESRQQYDSTDPQAFLLETASGYRDYMPQSAQASLDSALQATYDQAVKNDLSYVLEQGTEGAFSQLPAEQQERVLGLLLNTGSTQALLPEIQGRGGDAARTGTASGEQGHYVNSPVSSFSQLIEQGRLDEDLLDSLEGLQASAHVQQDLQSQREEIFTSTLQNIAFPERIAQHSKGTCAATRVEMVLAMEDPAKYTDTIKRLATPSGRARVGSAFLERVPGTTENDASGRSVASRLLQPALMEYANGVQLDYDNQADRHQVAQAGTQHLRDGRDGLTLDETRRLVGGMFGDERMVEQSSIYGGDAKPRAEVVADTEALMTEQSPPLLVDLDWGDNGEGGNGGHALLLTHLDDEQAYFMNPWGSLDTMPREAFDARLRTSIALSNPPALPPAAQDKGRYQPLASSRYENQAQRQMTTFQTDLSERAAKIQDPVLRQQVEDFLSTLSTQEEAMALAPALIGYVNAQDYDDVEVEKTELLLAMDLLE